EKVSFEMCPVHRPEQAGSRPAATPARRGTRNPAAAADSSCRLIRLTNGYPQFNPQALGAKPHPSIVSGGALAGAQSFLAGCPPAERRQVCWPPPKAWLKTAQHAIDGLLYLIHTYRANTFLFLHGAGLQTAAGTLRLVIDDLIPIAGRKPDSRQIARRKNADAWNPHAGRQVLRPGIGPYEKVGVREDRSRFPRAQAASQVQFVSCPVLGNVVAG